MKPVAQAGNGKNVLNVEIFGVIGWDVDAAAFSRELKAAGEVDEINLSIHSEGGNVLDGWAVANMLLNHKAKVRGRVEGLAASMASVILMACDEREVPENAYVMIHNVSGGGWGGGEEMRRMADLIDKLTDDIANFLSNRTGQELDQIKAWMDADTYMNGAEALEHGFATEVLPAVEAAALLDGLDAVGRLGNLPEDLAALENGTDKGAPKPPAEEPAEEPTGHAKRLSMLAKLRGLLSGGAGKGEGSNAEPAQNLSQLQAQLRQEREARESAENRADAAELENKRLQQETRDFDAALEEMGLSAAAASDLPANGTEDEVLSVKEQFAAMPKGEARTAFFKKHQAELES